MGLRERLEFAAAVVYIAAIMGTVRSLPEPAGGAA